MTTGPVSAEHTAAARWRHPVPERLPAAAWALTGSCLVGQLLLLADVGAKPVDEALVPSMALGGLLVGWMASGVLAARTVRLAIAWVLFVLGVIAGGLTLVEAGVDGLTGWPFTHFLTSTAALLSLTWFSTTPYYFWQRTRPRVKGPSRTSLVLVAVVVGLLGGVLPARADAPVQVHFGDL